MPLISNVSLAVLTGIGVYTLHVLSAQNGLFEMIESVGSRQLLSDGVTPWPQWLKDYHFPPIGGLLGFFWPIATAEQADVLLSGVPFTGGAIAAWTVILLEAQRNGVKGGAGSYTTLYGLLVQIVGFAVVSPFFLLLSLLTSTIPSSPTPLSLSLPSIPAIKSLPYALTLGFIVPTVLMFLPSPNILSFDAKVAAVLAWQVFPLWVTLFSMLLKPFFSGAANASPAAQLPHLRRAYAFGLVLSSISHIYTVGLVATSIAAPSFFTPAAAAQLSPANILLPVWDAPKVVSVAEGGLRFLKWDYVIGSAAHVIWAVATTSKVRLDSPFSLGSVWVDAAVRSAFLGPLSAALCLIWERDEAVLGGEHLKTR